MPIYWIENLSMCGNVRIKAPRKVTANAKASFEYISGEMYVSMFTVQIMCYVCVVLRTNGHQMYNLVQHWGGILPAFLTIDRYSRNPL